MKITVLLLLVLATLSSCLTSNFELTNKEKVNAALLGKWEEDGDGKVFIFSKKNDKEYTITAPRSDKVIEIFSVEIKGHHIFNIRQNDEKIKNIFFGYTLEDDKLTVYDISDKYREGNGLKDFKSQKELMKYIKKNIDKEDFFNSPEYLVRAIKPMSLLSYINKLVKETGYVYAPFGEDKRFGSAIKGTKIENNSFAPPWIIVYKNLEKIILTKWPGKLFEVEILNPAKEEHINESISKDADYLRTTGVKILKELPTYLLFGKHESEIETVLNSIQKITPKNVAIGNLVTQDAREIFSKAWDNWINDENYSSEKNYDTLKIFSEKHQSNSPINEGLSIIKSTFDKRAVKVLDKGTWVFDEDDNASLNDIWHKASEIFLHAAMSFEPHNLLSKEKKEILRKSFNTFIRNSKF